MRTLRYTLIRFCLVGILFTGTAVVVSGQLLSGEAKEKGFNQDVQAQLQNVLNSFVHDPAHPYVGGMSAAIEIEGLAYWQGASGYAARNVDAQNNPLATGIDFTPSTPSQIYSITKSFTAALVLELVNEGTLKLSDPVSKFLPFLASINPKINLGVTIHQLLAHESGYSDFWLEDTLQGAIAMYPDKEWNVFEALHFVHQISEPGGPRRYSSTNYIMLGAIVEVVTGVPIQDHFRERFFNPLQLKSMYLRGRETPIGSTMAAPHDDISALNFILGPLGWPTFPAHTITNISALPFTAIASLAFTSGGIVSNVADVAKWGTLLFSGKATSKATLDMMLKSIDTRPDEDGDYLGYGIWRTTKISKHETFLGHDGNSIGYRSVMFYQPEKKLTIAILFNDGGADRYAVAAALYKVLLKDFYCGNDNRQEPKVQLCYNGKMQCVAQSAAQVLMEKGATPGACASAMVQQVQQSAAETGGLTSLRISPNPVTNRAVLSFRAEQSGPVSLRLYDINGRLVTTLFEGVMEKGAVQQVVLERASLPAGVYFSRLQTAAGITQKKVVLNR